MRRFRFDCAYVSNFQQSRHTERRENGCTRVENGDCYVPTERREIMTSAARIETSSKDTACVQLKRTGFQLESKTVSKLLDDDRASIEFLLCARFAAIDVEFEMLSKW